MLDYGANVNVQDKDGRTPLMHAIHLDFIKLVEELLPLCDDINVTDNHDRTCMDYAIRYGRDHLVDMLVEYGAERPHKRRKKNSQACTKCTHAHVTPRQFWCPWY